jgi:tRNA (cmo5U34)-methyltransferase
MSTREQDKTSQEPEHSPEEASRWFAQWHLYRSIVDANWMCHREIFGAVRSWVLLRYPGPFTLLDLGCGDAGFIRETFENTGLWAYTGVDASAAALSQARKELVGARFQVELREADMLVALDAGMGADADVILASYSVHHLPAAEKLRFCKLAFSRLSSGGTLLFADVFRRDGETRDEYLAAYVNMMREAWVGLAAETLEGAVGHVRERDFPETRAGIYELAREAGFREEPRELFRDGAGFHRLLAVVKGVGG